MLNLKDLAYLFTKGKNKLVVFENLPDVQTAANGSPSSVITLEKGKNLPIQKL